MKSLKKQINKYIKDTSAVFGLTSVQSFFAIILGVALLAYVIVVIMGTLVSSNINMGPVAGNQTNNILNNVSTGITSFFTAINPVYAILAVLVIILVLVVLVRVVTGGTGGTGGTPQI